MISPESTDVERLLDPSFLPLVGLLDDVTFDEEFLAQIRVAVPSLGSTEIVERADRLIAREDGVSVRVHRARGTSGKRPCVLSIHGGGYIMGSPAMDDPLFESWCPTLGLVGVSVDYRLAPEAPYPAALEDCYLALSWVFEHAEELGIDADLIGTWGGSAGGGLAAALALLVRDRGEWRISFQMLESPMLDDRQQTPSSQIEGLPVWSRDTNEFGWRSYLGQLYGNSDLPIYAAPARATDLTGLPPTFISATGVDGFRDEDTDFALRLQLAGVETEFHVVPGAPHGYQMIEDSYATQKLQRSRDEWLRWILERNHAPN
jgi:acetyl esterase/lipase